MRQTVTADRLLQFMRILHHNLDLEDVQEMFDRELLEPDRLLTLFASIEDKFFHYPAINPVVFRRRVERTVAAIKAKRDGRAGS